MNMKCIKELIGHSPVTTTLLYSHVVITSLKISYNETIRRSTTHARPSIENKPQY